MENSITQTFIDSFSASIEFIALCALLIILSKLILESLNIGEFGRIRGFEKRIPPQKASLIGQRAIRRMPNNSYSFNRGCLNASSTSSLISSSIQNGV